MALDSQIVGPLDSALATDAVLVNLEKEDADLAGFAVAAGEVTDGVTGAARQVRPLDVSPDFRLRVGIDNILWDDVFNHGIFNTSRYIGVTSTQTITFSGGRMILNGGSSTASGAVSRVQTLKTFSMVGTYALCADFWIGFSAAPQTNNVCEFGFGFAATTAAPTDGVFFRLNGSGELRGVINNNGSETQTGTLTTFLPGLNELGHFFIVVDEDTAEFWGDVNGEPVMLGSVARPAANAAPALSQALPLLLRNYNSAVTSGAQQMLVGAMSVSLLDMNMMRLWPTAQGGMLLNAISAPDGTTAGMTANFSNSAAAASATLSNTAAGYATLGGRFQFAAVAGAETDYALFGFTVPAATAAIRGRSLMIRGVRIETWNNGAAVAITGTVLEWALGVGATAVSLATTDSATAGTRAPRRIALGVQNFAVGAAIGAQANAIDVNFDAPLCSEPGTFVTVILKMPVGTATASQILRGLVMLNAYWE